MYFKIINSVNRLNIEKGFCEILFVFFYHASWVFIDSTLKYFCQDKAGIAQEKRIDIFCQDNACLSVVVDTVYVYPMDKKDC